MLPLKDKVISALVAGLLLWTHLMEPFVVQASIRADVSTRPQKISSTTRPQFKPQFKDPLIQKVQDAQAKKKNIVVHISDIHKNAEAQQDISRLIRHLITADLVDLVALEGAFRPLDLQTFHTHNDHAQMKQIANQLLETGDLTGPLHALLTKRAKSIPAVGVDDAKLHYANIQAFLRSKSRQDDLLRRLHASLSIVKSEKEKHFNPHLLKFDSYQTRFHSGLMGLHAYTSLIHKWMTHYSFKTDDTPQLNKLVRVQFFDLLSIRKKVKGETEKLFEMLAHELNHNELRELAQQKDNPWMAIENLSQRKNINLDKYGTAIAAMKAKADAATIRIDAILDEITACEDKIYKQLARSTKEKELIKVTKALQLKEKLVRFSLTPKEWEHVKNQVPDPVLTSFDTFYLAAEKRDHTMLDRTLNAIETHKSKITVLVTGGFHAKPIQAGLRARGIYVITAQPKITNIDIHHGSDYLNDFVNQPKSDWGLDHTVSPLQTQGLTTLSQRLINPNPSTGLRTTMGLVAAGSAMGILLLMGPSSLGLISLMTGIGTALMGLTAVPSKGITRNLWWEFAALKSISGLLLIAGFPALVPVIGIAFVVLHIRNFPHFWKELRQKNLTSINPLTWSTRYLLTLTFLTTLFLLPELSLLVGTSAFGIVIFFGVALAAELLHPLYDRWAFSKGIQYGFGPAAAFPEKPKTAKQRKADADDSLSVDRVGDYLAKRRLTNFEDDHIHQEQATFVLLPIKDGADKVAYWVEQMTDALLKMKNTHTEIIILANGSTDDIDGVMRALLPAYRSKIRITFIEVSEEIGKNRAVNLLYAEAKRRHELAKAYKPDLRSFLHFSDDDVTLDTTSNNPIESNIRLIMRPEEATARFGRPVKYVSTNPIAPPKKSPTSVFSPISWWRYFIFHMTNVRKFKHGVALDQIYGQSYTMDIDDYPEEGVPEVVGFEDCYLCAYGWPHVITNPDAHHYHAEPESFRVFATRFVRDTLHRRFLGKFFKKNPDLAEKFDAFVEAREASHDKLTKRIRSTGTGIQLVLMRINEFLKFMLVLLTKMRILPRKKKNIQVFTRGTNVANWEEELLLSLIRTKESGYGVVSSDNVIYTGEEALWSVVIAMGLDTNFNNQISIKDVQNHLAKSSGTSLDESERLHDILVKLWGTLGKNPDQTISVLDFSLALEQAFIVSGELAEFFIDRRLFLFYHTIHNKDDWVLAYNAFARMRRYLETNATPKILNRLIEIAHRSEQPMSPLLVQVIFNSAVTLKLPIQLGDRQCLVQKQMGRSVWKLKDMESGREFILVPTTNEEVERIEELSKVRRGMFLPMEYHDPILGLRMLPFVEAQPMSQFIEDDHPLEDWLDMAIQLGDQVQVMHEGGYFHGDLRRPHALIFNHTIEVQGDDGTQVSDRRELVMLNAGATEWQDQMSTQTDVYGLATFLYYGLTKADPSLTMDWKPLPNIPLKLQNIIQRGLGKHPLQPPYESIEEMVKELIEIRNRVQHHTWSQVAMGAIAEMETSIPALEGWVTWNGKEFTIAKDLKKDTLKLSQADVELLVRMQDPTSSRPTVFSLACCILEGYLRQNREAGFEILKIARAQEIPLYASLTRFLVQNTFYTASKVADELGFRIKKELNPKTFLVEGPRSPRESFVIKITSQQEYDSTRLADPAYALGFDPITGLLRLRFYPEDLKNDVEIQGPTDLVKILGLFADVADKMKEVNEKGLIHRDLFYHNLRKENGVVRVIDYGLSEKHEPTTRAVDSMVLGQELHNVLIGVWRWIPLAYRFNTLHGGPDTIYVHTVPKEVNDVIQKAVRREYTDLGEMADDLRKAQTTVAMHFQKELDLSHSKEPLERMITGSQDELEHFQLPVPANEKKAMFQALNKKLRRLVFLTRQIVGAEGRAILKNAWALAREVHMGQDRHSTDPTPYLDHVVQVALIALEEYKLFEHYPNETAIAGLATALLHDTIEDIMDGDLGDRLIDRNDGIVDIEKERKEMLARIITGTGQAVGQNVRWLSKPPAKSKRSVQQIIETERRYIETLLAAPPLVQFVKIADWHHNLSELRTKYNDSPEDRQKAQYYFQNRIAPMLVFIGKASLPLRVKIKFLESLLHVGHVNNRYNKEYPGAEEIVVMTDDIQKRIEKMVSQFKRDLHNIQGKRVQDNTINELGMPVTLALIAIYSVRLILFKLTVYNPWIGIPLYGLAFLAILTLVALSLKKLLDTFNPDNDPKGPPPGPSRKTHKTLIYELRMAMKAA